MKDKNQWGNIFYSNSREYNKEEFEIIAVSLCV